LAVTLQNYTLLVYFSKRFQLISQDGFNSPRAKTPHSTVFKVHVLMNKGLDFQTKTR